MSTNTLLQLKSRFWRHLGLYATVTATGGSTSKFTVASLADLEPNRYQGWQLRVLTGASAGDLRVLGAGPNASGDLEPKRAFSSTGPVATDTAELWGNPIDGGDALTALFNDVLSIARPYVPTKLTIVTGQRVYDITTSVRDPKDVRRVSIRDIDSAAVVPYTERFQGCWRVYNQVNASTSAREIKIDLGQTLTAQTPATQELYIHSYKTLPAFTTDTSTVEAEYADWLAWEAVLRHAVDQWTQSKADKPHWERLANRAKAHVEEARQQFAPYVPLYIRPFEASR